MNIISNFQRVSGANDDNILTLDTGVNNDFVSRGIYIDNNSSQNKITLSAFNTSPISFSLVTDGEKAELFTISKSDFPRNMKDSDVCGSELAHIIASKLFSQSFTRNVKYVGAVDSYPYCVEFEHNANIYIDFGGSYDFATYFNGSTLKARYVKDDANGDINTKYSLYAELSNGNKATSVKSGKGQIDFNLRHIVGGAIKEPIEVSLKLTEENDIHINDVDIMGSVLLLPNAQSLNKNISYQPIQWISDRANKITRAIKGKEFIVSAINVDGFVNTQHLLKMDYYTKDFALIETHNVQFRDMCINRTTSKVANISVAGLYTASSTLRYLDLTIINYSNSVALTDTIRIELVDYCTSFTLPNLHYINQYGGIDTFNLFDALTTAKKAENAVSYKGLRKGERAIAYRTFTQTSELNTILLNKDEYDMALSLINSIEVKNESGVVLVAKTDGNWSSTDTAKHITITLDDAI